MNKPKLNRPNMVDVSCEKYPRKNYKLYQPDVEITTTTVYSDSAANITNPDIEPNDVSVTNIHISIHNSALKEVKKEWEVYQCLCVSCPREKICHDKCEHCDEYEEALNEEIES